MKQALMADLFELAAIPCVALHRHILGEQIRRES